MFRTFGSTVASLAADKECSEALSTLSQVVQTIEMNSKENQAQYREPLCSLYGDILQQCSDDMVTRLDCTEISAGQELMEFLVNTKCDVSLAALQSTAALAGSMADKTKECLSNTDIKTSAVRSERLGIRLESRDTAAVMQNARKPVKLGFTRRKRETIANMLNNFIRTLSRDEVSLYSPCLVSSHFLTSSDRAVHGRGSELD